MGLDSVCGQMSRAKHTMCVVEEPEGGDARCYQTGLGELEGVKKEPGSLIASDVLLQEILQFTLIDRTS